MSQENLSEDLVKAIDKSIYLDQRIKGIFAGLTDILNNSTFDDAKKVELIRAKAQDLQYAIMENDSAIAALQPYLKPISQSELKQPE